MNLQVLKDALEEIIEMTDEIIEETGMEGDHDFVESVEKDAKLLKGYQERLSHFRNSELHPSYIVTAVTAQITEFDFDLFQNYLLMLVVRNKAKIDALNSKLEGHKTLQLHLTNQETI